MISRSRTSSIGWAAVLGAALGLCGCPEESAPAPDAPFASLDGGAPDAEALDFDSDRLARDAGEPVDAPPTVSCAAIGCQGETHETWIDHYRVGCDGYEGQLYCDRVPVKREPRRLDGEGC